MKRIIMPVIILLQVLSWNNVHAQDSRFSLGVDVSYNLSPIKLSDSYDWKVDGLTGNFSPALAIRYGDRLAGAFRVHYIKNKYIGEDYDRPSGGLGGGSWTYYNTTVHQVYLDFLFEYSIKSRRGMYFHIGPAVGIPVKMVMDVDHYWEDYQGKPYEEHYGETLDPEYFADLQCVMGCGAYIPLNDKNLFRFEMNFRVGVMQVPISWNAYEDFVNARTIGIQFIAGYLYTTGK
jgi:hypothetical protein